MESRRPRPRSPPGRGGRENKGLRRKGPPAAGGSEEATDGRKPKFLDRFASIRIPGSKKERPGLPHMKQSQSTDWSSTPTDGEDFVPKPLSEREIIALFEKMMEDMNLNEDKKMPLREKDFNTKKEMVMQYISTASKSMCFTENQETSGHCYNTVGVSQPRTTHLGLPPLSV